MWKIVDSEIAWVVAHSADEAVSVLADYFEMTPEEYRKDNEGFQVFFVPHDRDLTIRDADDPKQPAIKKSVLDWLAKCDNPCLLASTAL